MNKDGQFYILDREKKEAVLVDITTWSKWLETADRTLKITDMSKIIVSTVFLGMEYDYTQGDDLLLFGTLVLGGTMDGYLVRYATWDEAIEGHHEVVGAVLLSEDEASNADSDGSRSNSSALE